MMNASKHKLSMEEIAELAPSATATAAHESRSERYCYIPTSTVIEGMQKAGFEAYAATQSSCRDEGRRDFTKHMIRFRREEDMARAAVVGELVPEIVMVNGHDGTTRYKLNAGVFRFACANGLLVADSTLASISVMHRGDVVAEVIQASLRIAEQSGTVLETIKQWKSIQLSYDEQVAFATSAHRLRFESSEGKIATAIQPTQLLNVRRMQDNRDDLWSVFNRIQENVIKGGLRGRTASSNTAEHGYVRGRRMSTREVTGIGQDVKLNRALWTRAEAMAELKTMGVGIEPKMLEGKVVE
jgi:hypothetical protein